MSWLCMERHVLYCVSRVSAKTRDRVRCRGIATLKPNVLYLHEQYSNHIKGDLIYDWLGDRNSWLWDKGQF